MQILLVSHALYRSNGKSEIKDKIISQIELNIPTMKKISKRISIYRSSQT